MKKSRLKIVALSVSLLGFLPCSMAFASDASPSVKTADQATVVQPDALIKKVSEDVIDAIKDLKSKGKVTMPKVATLVDAYVMPAVDFEGMAASTVGPSWRNASAEQKKELQQQFKQLLIRTYTGALQRVSDQSLKVIPLSKGELAQDEVMVTTMVSSASDGSTPPVKIKFRLAKVNGEWKVIDLNIMEVWLMQTYRSQFKELIDAKGLDGLIERLKQLNESSSKKN